MRTEEETIQGETAETGRPVEKVGAYLKARREAQGLTLDALAAQTRIKRGYLEAIEADDYEALPSGPFISGFITSYARALGVEAETIEPMIPEIDPPPIVDPAVRQDPEWKGPPLEIRELPVGGRGGTLSAWGIAIAIALVAVTGAVLLTPSLRSWLGFEIDLSATDSSAATEEEAADAPSEAPRPESRQEAAPSSLEATAPPARKAGGAGAGAVAIDAVQYRTGSHDRTAGDGELKKRGIRRLASIVGADDRTYVVYSDETLEEGEPQQVEVAARYRSYLRVSKTLDGEAIFEDILPKGSSKRFTYAGDLWMVVGNSGGVDIYYDGTRLPTLGKLGEKKGVAFRVQGVD